MYKAKIKDPAYVEMKELLAEAFPVSMLGPVEFLWASEVAIYWFSSDYHGGQSSNLYKALCQSRYRPSCLCGGIEDEDMDFAEDMYNFLVENLAWQTEKL